MTQFKKLEKLFNRNLADCFEKNGIKVNKEDFFNYIVEYKPQATMSCYCETYAPAIEKVVHWLHTKHFIDKNKMVLMDNIHNPIEDFVRECALNSSEIQLDFHSFNTEKLPTILERILHLV